MYVRARVFVCVSVCTLQDYRNLIWVLKTMRIPCFMPAHVEADDTLAVLARKAVEQG